MSEVSVLVPSFNHAPFIERTLRSIFNQTLQPIKLLVIDDGSTDGSPALIEKVLVDCPFDSQLIVRENKGVCKTLNEGFSACKGEFFAYLGSDDIWLPEFLQKSVELLVERKNACLSFGNAFLIDDEDYILDKTENWCEFGDGDLLPDLLKGKIFPSPGVVYRRECLPELPWNEDSLLEDYDLYLRLAPKYDFAFLTGINSAWRHHEDNASKNLPLMFPEFMKAQEVAFERLNIDREEQDRLKKELWFEAAFNYIRNGYKKEAFKLMIENLSGAQSFARIIKLLIRIIIPQSLFQWNRNRKYRDARVQNGKLQLI